MTNRDDKTEKPTAQTRKKAKDRGEIVQSAELSGSVLLAAALLMLWGLKSLFYDRLRDIFNITYSRLNPKGAELALNHSFQPIIFPLMLFFLGLVGVSIGIHWIQTGGIAFRKRSKRGSGSSPIFLIFLKIGGIALIGFLFIFWQKPLQSLIFSSPSQKIDILFHEVFLLLLAIVSFLLLLGLGDFFYQRWRHERDLHMTRQEAKDERKEVEGSFIKKNRTQRK